MILERASPNINSPEDLYREFHTNMSQFREPPPYPGLTKQTNQTGLRQSFSGSETSTDVSVSSTENLASCQRQEPQGEETQTQQSCFPYDISTSTQSDYSILARLGMPTSGMELKSQNTPQIYVSGNTPSHGPHFATSPSHGQGYYMSSESGFSSASNSSSKLTMQDYQTLSPNVSKSSSTFSSPTSVSSYSSSTLYANYPFAQMSGVDANLLQFAPSGGQMIPQYLSSLPPPPEYPGLHKQDLLERPEQRRSYEVLGKPDIPGVRSQPDLSTFWESRGSGTGIHHSQGGSSGSKEGSQQSLEHICYSAESRIQEYDNIALQATRMVEVLTEENKGLREKLNVYDKKVSKLQKFELEIQKVHEAYEALVKSSKKREYLEQVMKKRLEEELKTVQQQNESLVRQLEDRGVKPVCSNRRASRVEPSDGSMETLLAKHKELLTVKERQDIELSNARSTILDQKQQIDILRTVQSNVRLEEECQRQQFSEYDQQIQEEITSLKEAYEKKEQTEKSVRQKLEKELEYCRTHHKQGTLGKKSDSKKDLNSDIKRLLDEKEAKILQLEKEVIQWKEQHLEESIRKLKLQELECEPRLPTYDQALPVSTDTLRLPTYNQSPMNTDTLIHEAKEEKLKNMEEVYQANCKVTELEAQVKSLTSQLSEKEAMLRLYQRSPMTRSSSVHTIYCTPHHSPRPSLIATGSLSRQASQDTSLFIKHKKTASSSALETSSKLSQDDLFQKIQSLQTESKSSSDTEDGSDKTIWQV